MPEWSVNLRNLYWLLRHKRGWDAAGVRRLYRAIRAEKQRLHKKNIDKEEIRLLCRYLSNMRNKHAETAWKRYSAQLRLPLHDAESI